MDAWTTATMHWLALPQHGLGALFVWSLLSATLLPIGSEPALYGLLRLQPELLWTAVLVAGLGNTLGGAVTYGMGRAAGHAVERATHRPEARNDTRALRWLERFGPKACLLAWVPVVGDPLCAVAGWLRLPFAACLFWMALGKFARYAVVVTAFV